MLKLALLFISLFIGACANSPSPTTNNNYWGQNATLIPGYSRLSEAAKNAASHPSTWAPLIGAAIMTIHNKDSEITEHAYNDNPLFGSADNADDASDLLRDSLLASVMISSLATPGGDNTAAWWKNKSKGLLVQYGAIKSTNIVTGEIKSLTKRERPNKISKRSFPSGHSSESFAAATLTSRNLDAIALSENQKTGVRIGLYTMATGTAWARIEAGMHHPTDVLAGAALGNFLANFIHEAFMGDMDNVAVKINSTKESNTISIRWDF